MSKRAPEIFIVGTMKGGTTILYDYLCAHPRVLQGRQKEIHYFSLFPARDLSWYIDQYPDRADDEMCVDASPTYFDVATMPTVPAYIKKAVPAARIIIIVRDPVARAISHFQHLRGVSHKEMFEHVDVNEFLSRPLERCYDQQIASDYMLADVLNFSIYDVKFTHYINTFGRENVLLLTNEELRANASETMKKTFAFCNLPWHDSDLFGKMRYLSGSQNIPIESKVRDRLETLLYPSYQRFLRRAGLSSDEITRLIKH